MEAEHSVSISDYVAAIRRRRKLAVSVGLVIAIIAVVVAVALPDSYRATVVFGLKDTTSPEANRQNYQDQYATGLTRYVLNDANKRELIEKYNPYPGVHDLGTAMGHIDADVHTEMITGAILDPDSGHNKPINTGFSVAYDNQNPKVAYEVAQWLMVAFQKGGRENALVPVAAQVKFLDGEADGSRARIAELEAKLADFKKQNFDQLPDSAQANLAARNQTEVELSQIDSNITTQQQNRIFLMQQMDTARSTGTGADLAALQDEYKRKSTTYDASHPDMIALRRQIESARQGGQVRSPNGRTLQAEVQQQEAVLAEAKLRYSEDYPDVRRLQDNIKSLKARIAAGERIDPSAGGDTPLVVQLNSQIHATETQIAALQARRAELTSKLSQFETRLALTPRVERDFEALNRDLGVARQQYDELLRQRSQAQIAGAGILAGTADKFELLAAPGMPVSPSAPRRALIVIAGVVAGAIIALLCAITAEVMDGTVRGSADVLRILATAPLAVIPEIENSGYRRRRARQFVTFASCVLIAIPIMFILIRVAAR